jgi:hypothetical protein
VRGQRRPWNPGRGGGYEQTVEQVAVPASGPIGRRPDLSKARTTLTTYPAHVELRLDDETLSGAARVRNVGAVIDEAFPRAAYDAVAARAAARVTQIMPAGRVSAPSAPTAAPSSYALLPYEQPGIADPRGADITRSLLARLQRKYLDVKTAPAMDHFEVFARGAGICAATGAQAIIVPALRVEQSSYTARSHASLRLSLLSCGGAVLRQASAEADIGNLSINNFGAAVVDVSERAMDSALAKLFPDSAGVTH